MTGHLVYEPPVIEASIHVCDTPTLNSTMVPREYADRPFGTVWECDECHTLWRISYSSDDWGGGKYWQKVKWYHRQPWRKLQKQEALAKAGPYGLPVKIRSRFQ